MPSNTFSWAATPRSVFDLTNPLPRGGIYIWLTLRRPKEGPSGPALRPPLQLRDASLLAQEGAPRLSEFRFEGRYRRQFEVMVGVDFGRPMPSPRLRALADRVLRRLVFPRWTPFPQHRAC